MSKIKKDIMWRLIGSAVVYGAWYAWYYFCVEPELERAIKQYNTLQEIEAKQKVMDAILNPNSEENKQRKV